MKRKNKPTSPVPQRLDGVRRVSKNTVVATRATIEADARLRNLLGDAEPEAPRRRAPVVRVPRQPPVKLSDADTDAPPRRKNSRAKGKAGELEFKELLREAGWPDARRGQQRAGVDQADVIDGPPGVHFEVKRVENLNVWAAHEQATRDAPAGHVPVVAMRRNRSSWLAVLPMHELLQLLAQRQIVRIDTTPPRSTLDELMS